MVLSVIKFLMTLMLAAACSRALIMSEGDIPVLAFMIPALWIFPQSGLTGLLLLGSLSVYGLTLPHQPVALSVSTWILFPVLMVAFSSKCNTLIRALLALSVLSMEAGILITQSNGGLEGSVSATLIQIVSVVLVWYASATWKPSGIHSWWSLAFILPIWIAGWHEAALVALSVTGIIAACESLKDLASFSWHKLLYWSLPTVGFAALITMPQADIPSQVLVAWLFILGSAWSADYVLSVEEYDED